MDQDRITLLTRRGIREPSPVKVSDDEITYATLQGVYQLGLRIKQNDPSFFNTRKSITSTTHIYAFPSDALTILRLWDLGTTAGSVTATANSSGVVKLTIADHGFADNDIVTVHDVGGTTEANGTWQITYVDENTFTLDGSVYTNAWTSGGKVYKEPTRPHPITKINLSRANLRNPYSWYPRGRYVVVDDTNYTNDIIIDYIKSPSAITDIPAEYHMGLVAFNVITLLHVPKQDDMQYADLTLSYQNHSSMLKAVEHNIDMTFHISAEPTHFDQEINYDSLITD